MRKLDVTVLDEGTIWLFSPVSEDAREWFREHVQQDGQKFGASYAVEHRYARDLLSGVLTRGFRVQRVL